MSPARWLVPSLWAWGLHASLGLTSGDRFTWQSVSSTKYAFACRLYRQQQCTYVWGLGFLPRIGFVLHTIPMPPEMVVFSHACLHVFACLLVCIRTYVRTYVRAYMRAYLASLAVCLFVPARDRVELV